MLYPPVDIIIPVYNRKKLLKRAVQSVQNQSYKNWNLFIVDDGSSEGLDDFLSWIKGYKKTPSSTSLHKTPFLSKEREGLLSNDSPKPCKTKQPLFLPDSEGLLSNDSPKPCRQIDKLSPSPFEPDNPHSTHGQRAGYSDEPYPEIKRIKLKSSDSSQNQIQILKWENNKGVSYARNQGIKQGQAKWIAFLDSDDEWLPHKLEKQMEYAKNKPQCPFIHCNELWLKNGKAFNQKKKHNKQGGRIFIPSVRLCCVSPSATIIKRSLFEEVGLFREDFPVCEDYELWLRITSRYNVGFLNEPLLIKHGGHKDQLSKKYFAMDSWRIKALLPYIKSKDLSLAEQKEVQKTLIEKLKIVLKGCKKHKNFKIQKEMEDIYEKLSDKLRYPL